MSHFSALRSIWVAGATCALMAGALVAHAQQVDGPQTGDSSQAYANSDQSPGRVARLAYLSGQVQFQPAGESDWGTAELNRPMVIGDRLLTGDDGRAVLELGDASVRLDNDSAFDFLNLAEDNVQIELSQGTLNAAVRQLGQNENFEVDTPTVAFVASAPGIYRIDDDPSGTGSMVTVFQGSGTVYGENGASRQVVAGTSYRFNDSTLTSVDVNGLPSPDDFDRFCEARDAAYNQYAQQQQPYVPQDMIGATELGQYGQWDAVPEYGNVWYPTSVPAGWAPYRYGRWVWVDPWGWSWVDNAPWGFAPFHYGRWAYIGNRWGWMPGPINVQPVYAPAMVAFIGGAGFSVGINIGSGPVGWFPLGPRDVYVPWFHASRGYFNRVNVTNIRNVYVNQTVINNYYTDYRAGRQPPFGRNEYRYRNMPAAVTAVPRNVFTDARPVHPAALKLDSTQLARTRVAVRPGVTPAPASLGVQRPTARPPMLKGREPFARPVVARHQPPPRPVEFAARQKIIANQHGEPLTATQMRDVRKARPAAEVRTERVKLVTGAGAPRATAPRPGTTPPRPTETAHAQPVRAPTPARAAEPAPHRTGPTEPPFKNTVRPIQVPINRGNQAPPRPGELPSARFAHPRESTGTMPRVPVVRPAGEPPRSAPTSSRLPVVRPVERAAQSTGAAEQRAREQQLQQPQPPAEQRARAEQTRRQEQQHIRAEPAAPPAAGVQAQQQQQARQQQRQQRDAEMQAQQRQREQAAQQQMRNVQVQQQQRAVQMQQQRTVEMQQQRAVQMQQQRAVEMQRQQPMMREQETRRPPPPRAQPNNERHESPRKSHPPESSG